jgi:hypothetical protein
MYLPLKTHKFIPRNGKGITFEPTKEGDFPFLPNISTAPNDAPFRHSSTLFAAKIAMKCTVRKRRVPDGVT